MLKYILFNTNSPALRLVSSSKLCLDQNNSLNVDNNKYIQMRLTWAIHSLKAEYVFQIVTHVVMTLGVFWYKKVKFITVRDPSTCLKQIKQLRSLHTCAHFYELPSMYHDSSSKKNIHMFTLNKAMHMLYTIAYYKCTFVYVYELWVHIFGPCFPY